MGGMESGLPPPGGGSQGGGVREGQDISPPETEYGHAIHCDTTDSGALRGGGAAAGDTGPTAMVGSIGHRLEDGKGKGGKGGSGSGTGGSNREETETPGLGTGAVSEPPPRRRWTTGNTGEEASLGASGSSGAKWSEAED